MKKIFKNKLFILVALLMLPLCLLTACDETKYFSVSVFSSDEQRGSVRGPNSTAQLAEGREVELSATDGKGEFICWIKNSSEVVSTDQTYKFTINENTAGTYVGLFTQSEPSYMMYTALTKARVNLTGVIQYNIDVIIRPSSELGEQRSIYSGSLSDANTQLYNKNVFTFLNESSYIIAIEVEYFIGGMEEPLKQTYDNIQLRRNEFTGEQIEVGNASITLTFQKLTKNLVALG